MNSYLVRLVLHSKAGGSANALVVVFSHAHHRGHGGISIMA
ncbi:hypothetical protein AALB_0227 [Agarivorans albus MKT 106]|uniref:Uncharacterized protein n=1 Tax=Agarivorans albus MKT 106 TaxID=1331007 RepID=R9PFL9_AGAAL|nr:hypothetical protein AALB_0227 [Agarivorans albus MKT 106]